MLTHFSVSFIEATLKAAPYGRKWI